MPGSAALVTALWPVSHDAIARNVTVGRVLNRGQHRVNGRQRHEISAIHSDNFDIQADGADISVP